MNYYVHNLNPIAFEIFGMPFPWYWLVYFLGYFWVYFSVRYLVKEGISRINFEEFQNFLFYGFLVLLFSGKVFYILFYNLNHYLDHPQDILAIWKGGMSFHGALIGCGIWTLYYTRKLARSFWSFADTMCLVTPFVLFFGRIANFINGELAGRVTDVSWAVIFPKLYDTSPRHPSQIYEALLEGLLLFAMMWLLKKKLSREGFLSALFLIGYGVGRFIVEFFRMPDPQIGYLLTYFTIGQVYCLLMIFVGALILKIKRSI